MSVNSNSLVSNSPEKANPAGGSSEKVLCFIAYVLSLPGIIVARFVGKEGGLARHHARRSLELFLFLAVLMIGWFIIAHILMLVPYAGFPIAMAIFGIVVAAFVFCFALCVAGIVKAVKGSTVVFPFVSSVMSGMEGLFNRIGLSEQ